MKKSSHRKEHTIRVAEPHAHLHVSIEFGHPITVTDDIIPPNLTTENVAIMEMFGIPFSIKNPDGNDYPNVDYETVFKQLINQYEMIHG